jgi:CheY-like chemotaxis protein
MDAETQARVFEPFFTTKFSGRGLGLAAVLGIVRGHGAAIDIESAPGRGTTVRVLFPASEQPAEELLAPKVGGELCGAGRTILVVDDDPTVLKISREMLEARGFEVVSAADGAAALERVHERDSSISAVLLDMTMPHLDGIETLTALRDQRPDLAVVLTSGYSEQEAARRLEGQSPVSFVQKPFAPTDLDRAMGEAMEAVDQDVERRSSPRAEADSVGATGSGPAQQVAAGEE